MATSDVLARIDAELESWECGPDAARWRPDDAARPEAPARRMIADVGASVETFTHRMTEAMAAMNRLLATTAFQDMSALSVPLLQWGCIGCGATWSGAAEHECAPLAPPDPDFVHDLRVRLSRAFRIHPHLLGVGGASCACHSAPRPGGAEYARRRRTRHRRR